MYISFLGIASKYDYVQKHRGSNGYLTVNLIIRVVRLLFRVVVTSVQTNADTRGAENAQQILKKDLCRSVQLQQRKREESSSGLCQRIIHISTDQIIRTNFVSVCIKYPCMPPLYVNCTYSIHTTTNRVVYAGFIDNTDVK